MSKPYRKANNGDHLKMGSRPLQHATLGALWLLSFGLFPKIALTQDSSDPMEICFRMSDSAARLACFDSEMRRRDAVAHQSSAAPAAAATPAAAAVPAPVPVPSAVP